MTARHFCIRLTIVMAILSSAVSAPLTQAQTSLVMLGSGNPNADPERSGSALAIVVDDRSYLVDAGPSSCGAESICIS